MNGMEQHNACAFTGHRPQKFSFGYDEKHPLCVRIKDAIEGVCVSLYRQHDVRVFYSGCALGVDQWGASIILKLRERGFSDMRLVCAAPFPHFVYRWTADQRKDLRRIWDAADQKGFVSSAYHPQAYAQRNRFMVDRAHFLVAVCGTEKGGAMQTVGYAGQAGRHIIIINPDTGEAHEKAPVTQQ